LAREYFEAYVAFAVLKGELLREFTGILGDKLIDLRRFDHYDRSVELRLRDWMTEEQIVAVLGLGFERLWQHVNGQESYCVADGYRGEPRLSQ
jgi:hypothetical protein